MMDYVQKVSALASAGASTSYGSGAGYMTGYVAAGMASSQRMDRCIRRAVSKHY
jgi:hypothetical protein